MSAPLRQRMRDVVSLAVLVAGLLAARSSLADHYRVPSGSMRPTVLEGDHILVDKLAYGLRIPLTHTHIVSFDGPARGDVVVLDSPEDGRVLLKRVVALPDDHVEVRDGEIFIDGLPSPHAYSIELADGGGPDFGPIEVPAQSYLVLGDNRGDSRDGRSFGFVSRNAILGRATAIVGRHGRPRFIDLSE
jgi:signal peptidase I